MKASFAFDLQNCISLVNQEDRQTHRSVYTMPPPCKAKNLAGAASGHIAVESLNGTDAVARARAGEGEEVGACAGASVARTALTGLRALGMPSGKQNCCLRQTKSVITNGRTTGMEAHKSACICASTGPPEVLDGDSENSALGGPVAEDRFEGDGGASMPASSDAGGSWAPDAIARGSILNSRARCGCRG